MLCSAGAGLTQQRRTEARLSVDQPGAQSRPGWARKRAGVRGSPTQALVPVEEVCLALTQPVRSAIGRLDWPDRPLDFSHGLHSARGGTGCQPAALRECGWHAGRHAAADVACQIRWSSQLVSCDSVWNWRAHCSRSTWVRWCSQLDSSSLTALPCACSAASVSSPFHETATADGLTDTRSSAHLAWLT